MCDVAQLIETANRTAIKAKPSMELRVKEQNLVTGTVSERIVIL